MKELQDAHEKLGQSKAVFKLVLNPGRDEIELDIVNRYDPGVEVATNPVELLVASAYHESFNRDTLRFEKQYTVRSVYSRIESSIRALYLVHAPLKNPKQSTTFKWLLNLQGYNTPSGEGMIILYKYIVSAATQDPADPDKVTFEGGSNNPHVQNFLVILDKMRHKYEKK